MLISGESDGVQIKVEAGDSDDVQIVLKGVIMSNTNSTNPCYKSIPDFSRVPTNTLSVSSSNTDEDADVVIFKGDLTTITSTLNIGAKKNNGIKATDSPYHRWNL